jgi:hypothetical protein
LLSMYKALHSIRSASRKQNTEKVTTQHVDCDIPFRQEKYARRKV